MAPEGEDSRSVAIDDGGQPLAGAVRVDTPARLQMGLIDLRGDLGRLFGGLGVAVQEPRTVIELRPGRTLDVAGPDGERAADAARRFMSHHDLEAGVEIRVRRAIPAHVGLGSGTQLALAVSRGLAEVFGYPADVRSLASAVGRGMRSGVGSWTFDGGGFVVDGGHRRAHPDGHGNLAPLIGRYPMPAAWHCVIAIPPGTSGLSGEDEQAAFARLPPPAPELIGRISHLLLMGVLPALLEEDLTSFGRALGELQRLVGGCFAAVQGSTYASREVADLVGRLEGAGAVGAGQSSWGPTVYGLVDGAELAGEIASRLEEWMGGRGQALVAPFDNRGALVARL